MTDDQLKSALTFLEEDLEAARDIFMAAVESAASEPGDEIDNLVDEVLVASEEGSKDGFIVVEREAIEALRNTPYDASNDLQDALKNFNWTFRKALREFKAALVRKTAS